MHTKDEMKALLKKDDWAVHRAMARLYERQTAEEQASETTREHNGRGFGSWDAQRGTYYGKWVKEGKMLTGYHLARARKMAMKYAGQLAEIANERAAAARPVGISVAEKAMKAEREMQAMEVAADRAETLRDERNKARVRAAMEEGFSPW